MEFPAARSRLAVVAHLRFPDEGITPVRVVNGIRIKVCGITTLVDAEAADAIGADFLGFNFYPKSPRFVPFSQWQAMASRLPPRRKVVVAVTPQPDDLRRWLDAGFDAFQLHFPMDLPAASVAEWANIVGSENLWLAPKLPPGAIFPGGLLAHGRSVLWDTYTADGRYGGSGKTSDWTALRALREAHSDITWILAGGLNPENVGAALTATGVRFIDVNSGVESTPGVKDPAKLRALAAAMREATAARADS